LLEEHRDLVSPTDADALRRAGHGLAHHTWVGATPTAAEMREGVRTQISSFRDRYGYQPLSHRGHCCIWTGWSEQARILRGSGVLVDSNHYAYVHHQYGFVSGSGQGFEYVDEDGAPIGLWEQPTLMSDDCMLQDKTHLPALTLDEAIAETGSLIDALVTRWHGVYHVCLHPIYMRTDLPYPCTDRWAEAAAAHCRERGVPAISAEEWAAFLRARLSVTATDTVRDEEGLRITLRSAYPAAGLSMLLPEGSSSAHVNGVRARVCSRALEGRSRRIATWDMPAERDVQVRLGAESAQAAT